MIIQFINGTTTEKNGSCSICLEIIQTEMYSWFDDFLYDNKCLINIYLNENPITIRKTLYHVPVKIKTIVVVHFEKETKENIKETIYKSDGFIRMDLTKMDSIIKALIKLDSIWRISLERRNWLELNEKFNSRLARSHRGTNMQRRKRKIVTN